MSTNGKKIGVIGCGYRITDILKNLFEVNQNHKIISIYDPDSNSIAKFRKYFSDSGVCKSYEEIISNPLIEWIFIGSINYSHKQYIISALENNKNVFCEKPIAISLEECKEIKKIFENGNSRFFISYPLRYAPLYTIIKNLVENNKIGKIISFEFNETITFRHGSFIMTDWRRFTEFSGGHLLEKCCHDVAVANWIVNSLPRRVASFGGLDMFVEENKEIYDKVKNSGYSMKFYDDKNPKNPFISNKDIIDNQVIIIEYMNGVRASFHTNCSTAIPERRMYICGSEGTIRADLFVGKIEVKRLDENATKVYDCPNDDTNHGGGDLILVEELNNVMLYDKPTTHIDDAIKSAVTCILIDKARKEKKIIDLTPFWDDLNINY